MHDVAVKPFADHIPTVKWVKLNSSTHVPMFEEPQRSVVFYFVYFSWNCCTDLYHYRYLQIISEFLAWCMRPLPDVPPLCNTISCSNLTSGDSFTHVLRLWKRPEGLMTLFLIEEPHYHRRWLTDDANYTTVLGFSDFEIQPSRSTTALNPFPLASRSMCSNFMRFLSNSCLERVEAMWVHRCSFLSSILTDRKFYLHRGPLYPTDSISMIENHSFHCQMTSDISVETREYEDFYQRTKCIKSVHRNALLSIISIDPRISKMTKILSTIILAAAVSCASAQIIPLGGLCKWTLCPRPFEQRLMQIPLFRLWYRWPHLCTSYIVYELGSSLNPNFLLREPVCGVIMQVWIHKLTSPRYIWNYLLRCWTRSFSVCSLSR